MIQTSQKSYPQREAAEFLTSVATRILGTSNVATSTATRLSEEGIDTNRLAGLIRSVDDGRAGEFRFKLIDADPETPENFGVLVRRIARPPKTR